MVLRERTSGEDKFTGKNIRKKKKDILFERF